jgi:hypothetical protein
MSEAQQKLSLANLGDGGAMELFNKVLEEVLENIQDTNTKPDAPRSIVLTVTLKPDLARDFSQTEYKVVPKLAPIMAQKTRVFLSQRPGPDGQFFATEHNPKQPNLEFNQQEVNVNA